MPSNLYKNNETDVISWVDDPETVGVFEFTFDGVKFYNLFRDYPYNMTPREVRIFNHENPYWAEFFKERL